MLRTIALLCLSLLPHIASATPFKSRPTQSLPQCGGQVGIVTSNFGPKMVVTRVSNCSNIQVDGSSHKMFKADDGLYYFEMSLPDWDDNHQISITSNSRHTRDDVSFKSSQYPVKHPPFEIPKGNHATAAAINACQKAFYDQKNSLACVDFAKRHQVSSRTIEACGKVFYNNQSKLRCVQANRQPREIEACGISYGGEDSKVGCIERYALNPDLTPDVVRACITAFSQADFQIQCMDSAKSHRTAALQVIKSCESNYYGDSQRMVCMK